MHWDELPRTRRNEEESGRAYEQEESRRIAVFLKRAAWIVPLVLWILWLLRD